MTVQVGADGYVGMRITDDANLGVTVSIENCLNYFGYFARIAYDVLRLLGAPEPYAYKIHLGNPSRIMKLPPTRPVTFGAVLGPLILDLTTLTIPSSPLGGFERDAYVDNVVKLGEIGNGLHHDMALVWLEKILKGAQGWPKPDELQELLRRWKQKVKK